MGDQLRTITLIELQESRRRRLCASRSERPIESFEQFQNATLSIDTVRPPFAAAEAATEFECRPYDRSSDLR